MISWLVTKFKRPLLVAACVAIAAAALDYAIANGTHAVPPPPDLQHHGSAPEYSYSDSHPIYWQSIYWPLVREYLSDLPAGASLIDLGCGNGSNIATLRGKGWKLTGVDFSKSGIEIARKTWPDVRFEVADVSEDLSALGHGSYDAVVSTEVIEHIFLPRKFTANCMRRLKPGGLLIVTTPYNGYLKNVGVSLAGWSDRFWNPLWDYGHIKFWSVDTLSRLLYEAGFERVEWRGAGDVPHFWTNMVFRARAPLAGAEKTGNKILD